ncbi:MAG: hypothetical protein ACR2PH_18300 [Desulfobulbia bacterium]
MPRHHKCLFSSLNALQKTTKEALAASEPKEATMTAQVHERLILNGEETSMAYVPRLPDDEPRIEYEPRGIEMSSCWRGYIGTWAIRDNRFYLEYLTGDLRLTVGPLFANWFTGVLRVPRGEELHYVHMGFGSIYEEELHIKVDRGVVVKTKVISNRHKWIKRLFGKRKLHDQSYPGLENRFDGDDL